MIAREKLDSTQNKIEIEIRYGEIVNRNTHPQDPRMHLLKDSSLQNQIILGTNSAYLRNEMKMTQDPSQSCFSGFQYYFNPSQKPCYFHDRIKYLEYLALQDRLALKKCQTDEEYNNLYGKFWKPFP